jgi:hypothetical protein
MTGTTGADTKMTTMPDNGLFHYSNVVTPLRGATELSRIVSIELAG